MKRGAPPLLNSDSRECLMMQGDKTENTKSVFEYINIKCPNDTLLPLLPRKGTYFVHPWKTIMSLSAMWATNRQ